LGAVGGGDARRVMAAVLEHGQPVVERGRDLGGGDDADDAAHGWGSGWMSCGTANRGWGWRTLKDAGGPARRRARPWPAAAPSAAPPPRRWAPARPLPGRGGPGPCPSRW